MQGNPHSQPEMEFSIDDRRWMKQAIMIAKGGLGSVEPNPMVGCVLVKDGKQIAYGYHAKFGGPHAERNAIHSAIQQGSRHTPCAVSCHEEYSAADELRGCTAYVTLEPCCHHGKTPPCTDALLEVGVKRVVVAMTDPFPAVSGKGIELLRSAGVQVDVGLEREAAESLNAAYLKRLRTQRPWVIAKWAMSLDGRIATSTGHSQWISGESSRKKVHELRSRIDAILVGRGTAVADDPMLTARLPDSAPLRTALRVVVDSRASISIESKLVQTASEFPTLIWASNDAEESAVRNLRSRGCRVELSEYPDRASRLDDLLQFLVREYSATNVLVEGGGQLLGSMFDLRQIDECEVFIAPKLIGGSSAVSPISGLGIATIPDGPTCYDVAWSPCGDDMHFSCRLKWD